MKKHRVLVVLGGVLGLMGGIVATIVLTLFDHQDDGKNRDSSAAQVTKHQSPQPVEQWLEPGSRQLSEIEREIGAMVEDRMYAPDNFNPIAVEELEQELREHQERELLSSWQISEAVPQQKGISLNEQITVSEPVAVDAQQIAAVTTGDRVQMPLPGGASYTAVVHRVMVNGDGETSWSGYVEGHGQDFPVTFTIGEQNSFATVTTPEGLYAMETFNGMGWVYKTPDLPELVDPDQPDRLMIDQGGDGGGPVQPVSE